MLIKIYFPVVPTESPDAATAYREVAQLEIPNSISIDGIFGYCQNTLNSLYTDLKLRSLSVGDVVQISNTDTFILYKGIGIDTLDKLTIQPKTFEYITLRDVDEFMRRVKYCTVSVLELNLLTELYFAIDNGKILPHQFFIDVYGFLEFKRITNEDIIVIFNSYIPYVHSSLNKFYKLDYTKVESLSQLKSVEQRDVYLTVRDHLLRQFSKSRNGIQEDGMCMYRGKAGKKCAVGCIISDNEYKIQLENESYVTLVNRNIAPEKYESLLYDLQSIHDTVLTKNWVDSLSDVIAQYRISL